MKNQRIRYAIAAAVSGMAMMAAPASAQIFLKAPDFSGPPLTGTEAGAILPLPGAKPEELRAAMLWSMRAGLNVAALQCQFSPTLLTLNQYNALIGDHKAELDKAYDTLNAYFKRQHKTARAALTALDQYGTRTYLGFSTVRGQLGFCHTASRIGRAALFTKRGGLTNLASQRLQELRNSLLPAGEQQFPRFVMPVYTFKPINFDPKCWHKKKNTLERKCAV